jgi:hypothetical protein
MPGLRGRDLVTETVAQVLFDGRKMWNQGDVFVPRKLRGSEGFTPRPDAEVPSLCGSVGCLVGHAAALGYSKQLSLTGGVEFNESVEARWLIEAGKGTFDGFYDYVAALGKAMPLRGRAIREAYRHDGGDWRYAGAEGTNQIVQLVCAALGTPYPHWRPMFFHVFQRTGCRRHALLNFLALNGMTGSQAGQRLPDCEGNCADSYDEEPLRRRAWIAHCRAAAA